jgi:ribosomal protein L11 methyltransferase
MKNKVDWSLQWSQHGHNFFNGRVHIACGEKEIALIPGPGFGDFSHPTTRLVLHLMQPYVPNKTVLDVGCGSGVLAIGALAFGAKRAHGIDIDPEAIEHAKENAKANHFEKICTFSTKAVQADILLMNMIRSEQEIAYKGFKTAFSITSGILSEERELYLALTTKWGWKLVSEKEEEGWLGFVFAAS